MTDSKKEGSIEKVPFSMKEEVIKEIKECPHCKKKVIVYFYPCGGDGFDGMTTWSIKVKKD